MLDFQGSANHVTEARRSDEILDFSRRGTASVEFQLFQLGECFLDAREALQLYLVAVGKVKARNVVTIPEELLDSRIRDLMTEILMKVDRA